MVAGELSPADSWGGGRGREGAPESGEKVVPAPVWSGERWETSGLMPAELVLEAR